jgi:hypothetical protein
MMTLSLLPNSNVKHARLARLVGTDVGTGARQAKTDLSACLASLSVFAIGGRVSVGGDCF